MNTDNPIRPTTPATARKHSLRTQVRAGEAGAVSTAASRCPNCNPGSGTAAKYGSEFFNKTY